MDQLIRNYTCYVIGFHYVVYKNQLLVSAYTEKRYHSDDLRYVLILFSHNT
jgi:hypothetical protein